MTMSLEDQLTAYGSTIDDAVERHLIGLHPPESTNRPAAPQSRDTMRSHRWLVGAAAVVTIGLASGVAAIWPGSSSPAWADWTPATQAASIAEVDAVDAFCRSATNVGEMVPLIFDVRGSGAVAIYGDDSGWVTCHAHDVGGEYALAATTTNRGDDLAVARTAADVAAPIAVISLGWHGDPAASLMWGVRAAAVDTIEIETVDGVVEASASGDVWVGWWPTDDAATAEVRGISASGDVLVHRVAGELAPSLPDSATIAAAVASDGTELEREILADGFVTWPEFVTALDAWKACVAADGYDLTIEIDDATRTYQAISPIVSVDAPLGQPDDAAAHELLEPINASIMDCLRLHVSRIEQVFVQQ